jgi:pimeloyl-ACP methyl ester carboxylesterase
MRTPARTRFRYFSAVVFLALAGCRDVVPPTAPAADLQPALTVAVDGTLRDAAIDPRDTYFAFNVTTTRTVEGGGSSGGMRIASAESEAYETDESAYLEAGFGSDGLLRFNVYSEGAADPRLPDPPPVVRTVGNTVYVFDEWGNAEAYGFNAFLDGVGLPGGDLSSGSPHGNLYRPLGDDDAGGPGGDPGDEPIFMTGLDPQRGKVTRVRDDVLQITTTSAEPTGVRATVAGKPGLTTTRTFRRRGVPTSDAQPPEATGIARVLAHWMLESVEQTASVPKRGGVATVRTRTTYRYVAGHVNRGRDAQRERALRTASPPARQARAGTSPQPGVSAALPPRFALTPTSDGMDLCPIGDVNQARTVSPGGGAVVYQHGFCSDATTWSAMRQRVPETHRVGVEQSYSLTSYAPIESQVDDLAQRLTATGVPGNVVVAHSQGGLVARRLGQRRPDLVSGVVTIGTPHEGALIASRPAELIADVLYDAIGEPCFGAVCGFATEVAEGLTSGLLTHGVGQLIPAAGDDQPNSALIQRVNGRSTPQYETFRRASIAMNIPVRWAIFRMLGDGRSSRDRLLRGDPLKGRRYVRDAQDVYTAARALRYMAMALRWRAYDYGSGWGCSQSGYAYYWEPCYDPYGYSARWWQASYWYYVADALDYIAGSVVWVMDAFDRAWDDFTTGRKGGTDGFVQLASQHYPTYVPGTYPVKQYKIDGLEAHSGETASQAVLGELRLALDEARLPRQ